MQVDSWDHLLGGFLPWCGVPQHRSLSLLWGWGCLSELLLMGPHQQVGWSVSWGLLRQLWCIKPPRLTGKGDTLFYQSEKLRLLRAPSTSMPGCLPDLCHGQ